MPENIPVGPTPTKATDPTLGIASHIGAVAAGVIAGWASTYLDTTLDASTQAEIAAGIATLVATAFHWVIAKINQVQKS